MAANMKLMKNIHALVYINIINEDEEGEEGEEEGEEEYSTLSTKLSLSHVEVFFCVCVMQ